MRGMVVFRSAKARLSAEGKATIRAAVEAFADLGLYTVLKIAYRLGSGEEMKHRPTASVAVIQPVIPDGAVRCNSPRNPHLPFQTPGIGNSRKK
jgi:hypothetical protein